MIQTYPISHQYIYIYIFIFIDKSFRSTVGFFVCIYTEGEKFNIRKEGYIKIRYI